MHAINLCYKTVTCVVWEQARTETVACVVWEQARTETVACVVCETEHVHSCEQNVLILLS